MTECWHCAAATRRAMSSGASTEAVLLHWDGTSEPTTYMSTELIPDGAERSFATAEVTCIIADARAETGLTLHTCGFELLEAPTPLQTAEFYDADTVTSTYYAECCALVREHTGAAEVVAFDHNVRTSQVITAVAWRRMSWRPRRFKSPPCNRVSSRPLLSTPLPNRWTSSQTAASASPPRPARSSRTDPCRCVSITKVVWPHLVCSHPSRSSTRDRWKRWLPPGASSTSVAAWAQTAMWVWLCVCSCVFGVGGDRQHA